MLLLQILSKPAMPINEADPIHLSERERRDLQALVRQQTCPQHLALRARIILLADEGIGIRPSAERLGVARTTVRSWRRRWLATQGARVTERLADAPRPGAPAIYSAEDACAIIALACEEPGASGRAITHWTQRELAEEAIKRGIVAFISQRSVGRTLKRGRPQAPPRARLAQRPAGSPVPCEVP